MIYQDFCALPKRSYPLRGIPLYALPGVIVEEADIGGVTGGFVRKRYDESFKKNDDDEVLLILMAAVNGGILK